MQRTLMSFKSWLVLWRMLEVPDWGFSSWSWWEWVKHVINHLCSEFELFTLSLRCKKSACPYSPRLSCGGLLMFLTGVSVPDHDGVGSTMSQVIHTPNLSLLHWILSCREPACTLSPDWSCWGCWRMLVPDWGFSYWSWWGWVNDVPSYPCS